MSSGYTLKLDLSEHEHDVLINVLKRESYHPTVKAILYQITGYDKAVAAAKAYATINRLLESEE